MTNSFSRLQYLGRIRLPVALAVLVLAVASIGLHAAPYGQYDSKQLVKPSASAGGGGVLDLALLDRVIADLQKLAANYPPRFDIPQDAQRAKHDAATFMGMLGAAFSNRSAPPELLLRMGTLGALGHNLGIPGAADYAQTHFERLLKVHPDHAFGNLRNGAFLAGSARPKEALPFLLKAKAAGLVQASYSLGMAHLSLGDKTKALDELKAYQRLSLDDPVFARLIEAVDASKVVVQK